MRNWEPDCNPFCEKSEWGVKELYVIYWQHNGFYILRNYSRSKAFFVDGTTKFVYKVARARMDQLDWSILTLTVFLPNARNFEKNL